MSDPEEALQQTGDGSPAPTAFRAAPIEQLTGQVQDIQNVMDDLMQEGTHYDDVTDDGRNSLMQPGAEKLCFAFKFAPSFDVTREDYDAEQVPNADEPVEGHREYTVECKLHHRPTGQYVGSGSGSCSTLESKYRYRKEEEVTDVQPPQAFWDSYDKEQGENMGDADFSILRDHLNEKRDTPVSADADMGVEFVDNTPLITYETGRKENPDIADQYNTVLKIAEKRALVNAVKRSTAASDIFTQDTEDLAQLDGSDVQGQRKTRPSPGSPSGSTSNRSRQTKHVTRHGVTVTKGQADKIDQRGDALEERDGDELAAAIVAVEEEMEGWPSEALCEACDAMLDEHRQRLEESDSGKAEGASSKKQSEKPTKGSQQSDSPTTSPQKDEGSEDNGVQDPDEVKEAAQGVETASDEANDPEFKSDDDLPF